MKESVEIFYFSLPAVSVQSGVCFKILLQKEKKIPFLEEHTKLHFGKLISEDIAHKSTLNIYK